MPPAPTPLRSVLRPSRASIMHPSLLLRLLVGAGISSLLSTAFRPAGHTRFCLQDQYQRGCVLRTSAALPTPRRRASAAPSPWHDSPSRTHNRRSSGLHGRPRTVSMNANAGGESDRREFLARVAAGAVVGGLSSLAVAAGSPAPAGAFCGETYPYWAYYVDFDETFVPFEFEGYSGKLFTRTVGNAKEQKKVSARVTRYGRVCSVLSPGFVSLTRGLHRRYTSRGSICVL